MYSDLDTICNIVQDVMPNLEQNGCRAGSDEVDIRMLIHQSQAGCVIGKAGSKIKELRDSTGARIKIFSNTAPQSTDRIVQMVGRSNTIVDAIREIITLVKTNPIRGAVNNYDPYNYDDFYANEYGGYGSNSRNGPGGDDFGGRGGGGGGMRNDDRRGSGRNSGGFSRNSGGGSGGGSGMRSGGGGGGMSGGGGGRSSFGGRGGGFEDRGSSMRNSFGNRDSGFGGGRDGGYGGRDSFGGGRSGNGDFGSGRNDFGGGMRDNFNSRNSMSEFSGNNFNNRSGDGFGFGGNRGNSMDPWASNNGGPGGMGLGNSMGGMNNGSGMGNLGSGPMGGGGGPVGLMDGPGKSTTQVTIPKDLAGAIIGKAGSRIRKIRMESCADITIDEPLPGSNDRIITISGLPNQIQMAQYLLQQSVHQSNDRKF
ncbi:heterogeneous nuclear ribonucleoprotein K isoform X2 [Ctenocephalides felis]|nr:heterogeneous nuclear ribonucleoprotein K isoform X2 [Ctenocephalides felis]